MLFNKQVILYSLISIILLQTESKEPLSFITLHQSSNEIIFYNSYGNTPLIKGCYGTPSQCFKLKLSTTYNQNWLIGGVNNIKCYNKQSSLSYKTNDLFSPIKERGNLVFGKNSVDNFSVNFFNLNAFEFALIEQVEVFEYSGVLSFGYLHEEGEYAILDSLYATQQIQALLFYMTYIAKDEGKLVFGVYPKENQSHQYKRCALYHYKENGKLNHRWECQLNAIYYQGGEQIHFLKTNMRISFNLSANILLFPRSIYDQFVINYFGGYLNKDKVCFEHQTSVFTQIKCNAGFDYNKLGNVHYMLGKWSLVFKPQDLFVQKNPEDIEFGIMKHQTLDKFIFGNHLFKKFGTVFDREKNEIGIFPQNAIDKQ